MANWTRKRRLAFVVHLLYVIIPALAALVASVKLWTTVFGEWYFALPLIACLEGVAALGFYFKLAQVQSPFVPARHIIPVFSVATLAYELGVYLTGRLGTEAGLGFTALVTAVFGTLFVLSFGVLEKLVINPVDAAAEKAHEQASTILVQVAEHEARQKVYREFADRLRLTNGEVQPILTVQAQEEPHGLPFEAPIQAEEDVAQPVQTALVEIERMGLVTTTAASAVSTCDVCGGPLTASDKGVAGRPRWQREFGGKYACKACRDKVAR